MEILNRFVHLSIRKKRALQPHRKRASRSDKEAVALAEEFFCTLGIKNSAGVCNRRNLKRDAAGKIVLDYTGDDIHRGSLRGKNKMNTHCSGHGSQPGNGVFYLLGSKNHQVGKLVNHNHQIRHGFKKGFFITKRVFKSKFRAVDFLVIPLNITGTDLLQQLVPAFHLLDHPLESSNSLSGFIDNRGQQMRYAVIRGKLDVFRINQDKTHLLRAFVKENAADNSVDTHRFA